MPAFHKILLLYNPVAGRDHSARKREVLSAAQVFHDAGVEVELEPTRAKGEGGQQAKAALDRDFDAIFACGGDGTVFDVLQGMVHGPEQVALGVLPLGTANVLATDLGLPGDIKAAALATLAYVPRRIAAGQLRWNRMPDQEEARTTYFSVAAGVGFTPSSFTTQPGCSRGAAVSPPTTSPDYRCWCRTTLRRSPPR